MRHALIVTAITTLAFGNAAPTACADPLGDLVGLLPPGYVEGSCHPATAGPLADSGALAMVECSANSLPGGPVRARYTLFRDVSSLEILFTALHNSHHFEAVTCPGMQTSPAPWLRPDGKPGGSIACGEIEGGSAALLWTNDSGPYIALAEGGSATNGLQGPDINGLWGWWKGSVNAG